MTGLVLCHFVYGVVDGIEVEFLCTACDAHLVGICTCFGCHTLFKVCLGVPYAFAKELGKF